MTSSSFEELAGKLVKKALEALKKEEVDQTSKVQSSFYSASAQSSDVVACIEKGFGTDQFAKACMEPSSRDDQLMRNDARTKLFKFCDEYVQQVTALFKVHMAPQRVLQEAESKTLAKFKATEDALRSLTDQVKQAHEKTRASFASKHTTLEQLSENFKRDLARLHTKNNALIDIVAKVLNQKAEEHDVLQEVLDKELLDLQSRSTLFIKADESPTKNNSFQRVLEETDRVNERKRNLEEGLVEQTGVQKQLAEISAKLAPEVKNASSKRQRVSIVQWLGF